MLKFYYAPISANARRVWITLLEKQIPFEPIIVNLDGEQFQSEFTAINPLQRVPAIVDDELRIFESLAILDYLEAKYPVPELMPKELDKLAITYGRLRQRLSQRESFQRTAPTPEGVQAALPTIKKILETRSPHSSSTFNGAFGLLPLFWRQVINYSY